MIESDPQFYRRLVQAKLEQLIPVFARAAIGDVTQDVVIPPDEDEFTDLFVGIQIMQEVIREEIAQLKIINAELDQKVQDLQEANTRLTGSLRELGVRAREITLLGELGDLLQTCLIPEEAYVVVRRVMPLLFPDERGALYLVGPSRNLLESFAVWGTEPPKTQVFAPGDCWALRRGRMHLVQPGETMLVCHHLDSPPVLPYLCLPLMAQGEALGVFHLQNPPAAMPKPFDEAKQQLARTVADRIGLALANLKLRETLHSQSIRDPLTGLFNRRYMEETLERELARAARNDQPLGVIMLDLDHFKQFNDAFGHPAGDVLLHELGSFISAHVRESDIACRYGGEEFTLILTDVSLELTRQRAEQLRQDIKLLSPRSRGQLPNSITLSCGVAGFPEHGPSSKALLLAADAALYRAKRGGRDQVVVAP